MSYKVAIGYDVPLLDMADVVPQPKSRGVRATSRAYAGDGTIYEKAMFVELVFGALGSVAMYQDLLDQFNLNSYAASQVTIAVRGPTWASLTRYNGTAVRPDLGSDANWSFMPRDVIILIKNLEQLVEAA